MNLSNFLYVQYFNESNNLVLTFAQRVKFQIKLLTFQLKNVANILCVVINKLKFKQKLKLLLLSKPLCSLNEFLEGDWFESALEKTI